MFFLNLTACITDATNAAAAVAQAAIQQAQAAKNYQKQVRIIHFVILTMPQEKQKTLFEINDYSDQIYILSLPILQKF